MTLWENPTLEGDRRKHGRYGCRSKQNVGKLAVALLRQRALRFTQPYLQSDIYGVTTRNNRVVKSWDDIDKPGVQVAVQTGTFMEPVMAASLKQAKMLVIRPPQTREQELEAGRVDVFMTDYPYSRRLLDRVNPRVEIYITLLDAGPVQEDLCL